MPIIYEYLGITISFYTLEHLPIHVHVKYGNATMKVIFYMDGENITTIKYIDDEGKFPPAQKKLLRDFISKYKYALVYAWKQYFAGNRNMKKIVITKRIK